jgi:cytochrome-b5 reductase
MAADRKVLKPTEFQEFELKEKTILSHNTAMWVLDSMREARRCC